MTTERTRQSAIEHDHDRELTQAAHLHPMVNQRPQLVPERNMPVSPNNPLRRHHRPGPLHLPSPGVIHPSLSHTGPSP